MSVVAASAPTVSTGTAVVTAPRAMTVSEVYGTDLSELSQYVHRMEGVASSIDSARNNFEASRADDTAQIRGDSNARIWFIVTSVSKKERQWYGKVEVIPFSFADYDAAHANRWHHGGRTVDVQATRTYEVDPKTNDGNKWKTETVRGAYHRVSIGMPTWVSMRRKTISAPLDLVKNSIYSACMSATHSPGYPINLVLTNERMEGQVSPSVLFNVLKCAESTRSYFTLDEATVVCSEDTVLSGQIHDDNVDCTSRLKARAEDESGRKFDERGILTTLALAQTHSMELLKKEQKSSDGKWNFFVRYYPTGSDGEINKVEGDYVHVYSEKIQGTDETKYESSAQVAVPIMITRWKTGFTYKEACADSAVSGMETMLLRCNMRDWVLGSFGIRSLKAWELLASTLWRFVDMVVLGQVNITATFKQAVNMGGSRNINHAVVFDPRILAVDMQLVVRRGGIAISTECAQKVLEKSRMMSDLDRPIGGKSNISNNVTTDSDVVCLSEQANWSAWFANGVAENYDFFGVCPLFGRVVDADESDPMSDDEDGDTDTAKKVAGGDDAAVVATDNPIKNNPLYIMIRVNHGKEVTQKQRDFLFMYGREKSVERFSEEIKSDSHPFRDLCKTLAPKHLRYVWAVRKKNESASVSLTVASRLFAGAKQPPTTIVTEVEAERQLEFRADSLDEAAADATVPTVGTKRAHDTLDSAPVSPSKQPRVEEEDDVSESELYG